MGEIGLAGRRNPSLRLLWVGVGGVEAPGEILPVGKVKSVLRTGEITAGTAVVKACE